MTNRSRALPFSLAALMVSAISAATVEHRTPFSFEPTRAAEQQNQAPATTGWILTGRVIDGATGRAVESAAVGVHPGIEGRNVWGESSLASYGSSTRATTDGNGHFEVTVPAGHYAVFVERAGYRSGGYLKAWPDDGPAATFRLTGSGRREIEIRIWKDSALGGRVVDDAGEPVIDVEVSALRRTFVGGRPQYGVEARTDTDDLGRYRFPQLPPGDYVVGVAAGSGTWPDALVREIHAADQDELTTRLGQLGRSGAPPPPPAGLSAQGQVFDWFGPPGRFADPRQAASDPQVYHTWFHPSSRAPDTAGLVTIGPGQSGTNIDIALGPPVETHAVTGQLTGPADQVAGVAVSAIPVELQGLRSARGFEIATAVTGPDGRFVMLGVPAGSYVLEATVGARAWAPAPGTVASLLVSTRISDTVWRAPNRSGESVLYARSMVTVGDTAVADAQLTLRPGARVSGRIVIPSVPEPPAPHRIADTIIDLIPLDRAHEGASVTGRPDATGQFRTPEYRPGRYRLRFSRVDRRWQVAQVMLNGVDVHEGVIELGGEDINGLVVTLSDAIDRTLEGSVTGVGRELQPRIIVIPADVEAWITGGMAPRRASNRARADETGTFTVTNLLPGRYRVAAVPWDTRVDLLNPEWVRALAKVATPVEIRDAPGPRVTVSVVAVGGR